MPEFQLILTADYEVFGDGSGCVDKCIIAPSEAMMNICEEFNARITFFVDVCELWAFEEVEEKGLFTDNYRPATAIKAQLRDAIKRGHDVQLHFHPQWMGYEFISNYEWKLNMDWWRLSALPYGTKDDPQSVLGLFYKGKNYLESLLCSVDPDYRCVAFRAGAWCIQPEANVLKAMKEVGLQYECTVAPGMAYDDGLTQYDFTNAPHLSQWPIDDDVSKPNPAGAILEIPILTAKLPIFDRLRIMLASRFQKNIKRPLDCTGKPASAGRSSMLRKISEHLNQEYYMLDFCGKSFSYMKAVLEAGMKKFEGVESPDPIPLVAIGHPKNFGNEEEFRGFLAVLVSEKKIRMENINRPSLQR